MDDALETKEGRLSVRRMLTLLRKTDAADIYKRALEMVPLDFALSAKLCANSFCRFNLKHIGQPARATASSELCPWCDVSILAGRESSVQGRRLIAYALSRWAHDMDTLLLAWAKLSYDFRHDVAAKLPMQKEQHAMAKHDLVEKKNYSGSKRLCQNDSRLGGCHCNLCGQTFLWRQFVTDWEYETGQVEDAITYDRLFFDKVKYYHGGAGLNTGRCLSDGRTGAW